MINYKQNKILFDAFGAETIDYIDNFFIYLYNNPDRVNFTYDRAPKPTFLVSFFENFEITQKAMICRSRKLNCALNKGFDSSPEALDLLFGIITTELNYEDFEHNDKTIKYFLSLKPTIPFHDPTFAPRKGMILSYARIPYTKNIMPQTPVEPYYANNFGRKQMITPEMDPIEVLMRKIGYY